LKSKKELLFLKKRSKKLLLLWALARRLPQPHANKSLFASLFTKKAALSDRQNQLLAFAP
jgi:hypothetical protein